MTAPKRPLIKSSSFILQLAKSHGPAACHGGRMPHIRNVERDIVHGSK